MTLPRCTPVAVHTCKTFLLSLNLQISRSAFCTS